MMSIAIRIDNELYEEAKRSAVAECRTVPLQVAYWAKIGKAALDNPDLPIEFIRDTLAARKQGVFEPFVFGAE
jgi:hypothetical protein